MRKRKIKLWTVLTVCLVLVLTVQPVATRVAEAEENNRQVAEIEKCVASLGEGQLGKYRDLAKWYNHQLELGTPGLWAAYGNILNLGEGRMGILEVPEMDIRLPISQGGTGKAGHDPDTPLPIGGRGNHTVLWLAEVYAWTAGQTVYIDILGQRLAYRVESVQVMPAGWSVERPTEAGQDILTLACDRGHTRTLVRCERSSDLTVRQMEAVDVRWAFLAAAPLLALLLCARMRCGSCLNGDSISRIWVFYRKNREKSKLS